MTPDPVVAGGARRSIGLGLDIILPAGVTHLALNFFGLWSNPGSKPVMNRCRTIGFLVLWAAVLTSALQAQPSNQPNHVLQLDGTAGYVELPPGILAGLTEATIEGWVKWRRFDCVAAFHLRCVGRLSSGSA